MTTPAKPFRGMGLRRPCKHCPFRSDVPRYLAPERYREIAASLVDRAESFTCHETNDFDDASGEAIVGPASRACAGAMIWLQHQGRPNQLMQVMGRLGAFDPSRLDLSAPVHNTRAGFESGEKT